MNANMPIECPEHSAALTYMGYESFDKFHVVYFEDRENYDQWVMLFVYYADSTVWRWMERTEFDVQRSAGALDLLEGEPVTNMNERVDSGQ